MLCARYKETGVNIYNYIIVYNYKKLMLCARYKETGVVKSTFLLLIASLSPLTQSTELAIVLHY